MEGSNEPDLTEGSNQIDLKGVLWPFLDYTDLLKIRVLYWVIAKF